MTELPPSVLELDFKRPALELEFELGIPRDLRQLAQDFNRAAQLELGLGRQTVTSIGRSVEENRRVGGVATSLHLWEDAPAQKMKQARAVDFSVRGYNCTQDHDGNWHPDKEWVDRAMKWLTGEIYKGGGRARWELLYHSVLTGPHIHLGLKRPKKGSPR